MPGSFALALPVQTLVAMHQDLPAAVASSWAHAPSGGAAQ
eukprot:CAMPEP_0113287304 /NCGR_PEP_ID=MMETSP0008_2-20120614/31635_1 /TAXON_ID=97485 /ORGANISM="Prymnesium parvum" /LENGTH=39 /DNA_ID=CAMNT_0000138523 /DNA_START=80 /DNA_END=196 /DNA_ORIENTATION=+ /assembly_acc=CAM_ASM_000153